MIALAGKQRQMRLIPVKALDQPAEIMPQTFAQLDDWDWRRIPTVRWQFRRSAASTPVKHKIQFNTQI